MNFDFSINSLLDNHNNSTMGVLESQRNTSVGKVAGSVANGGDKTKGGSGWGFNMGNAFGDQGWALPAIQGIGVGVGAWGAIQGHKLAKRQLGEQKRQFNMNIHNQRATMEAQMRIRHDARVRAGLSEGSADEYIDSVGLRS